MSRFEVKEIGEIIARVSNREVRLIIKENDVEPYEMYGKTYDYHYHRYGRGVVTIDGRDAIDFTGTKFNELGVVFLDNYFKE